MEPAAADALLLDLVMRASLRERRALTRVLVSTYRVQLTQALRALAAGRARAADLDKLFVLAAQIAAAAADATLPAVRADAEALERSVAAAHLPTSRSDMDVHAAGLKVIERILAAYPDPSSPPPSAMS